MVKVLKFLMNLKRSSQEYSIILKTIFSVMSLYGIIVNLIGINHSEILYYI